MSLSPLPASTEAEEANNNPSQYTHHPPIYEPEYAPIYDPEHAPTHDLEYIQSDEQSEPIYPQQQYQQPHAPIYPYYQQQAPIPMYPPTMYPPAIYPPYYAPPPPTMYPPAICPPNQCPQPIPTGHSHHPSTYNYTQQFRWTPYSYHHHHPSPETKPPQPETHRPHPSPTTRPQFDPQKYRDETKDTSNGETDEKFFLKNCKNVTVAERKKIKGSSWYCMVKNCGKILETGPKAHYVNKHAKRDEYEYVCPVCNKAFKWGAHLKRHYERH